MTKEEQDLEINQMNRELEERLEALETEESRGNPSSEHRKYRSHRRKSKRKKEKKKTAPFKIFMSFVCIFVLLCIAATCSFIVLRMQGEGKLKKGLSDQEITLPQEAVQDKDGEYVTYNGVKYRYNENIITILFMGIDTSIQETGADSIGENGQADTLFLAVLDSATGEISLINISRDSMVDVNKYNVKGQYLGTEQKQICLAYAYGDGREKSCLNTVESVTRLLYGMPVNAYAAIDYSGISVLNDAVGGVTVEVLEDLTRADPALEQGKTVTLSGEQAHTYVRSRDISLLNSNNLRMNRQRQYLMGFIQTTLKEMKQDITLPLTLYQKAAQYSVTDIEASQAAYLTSLILQNGFTENDMFSVPGEVVLGQEYAEFIPDEQKLFELVLKVFYNKIN